MKSQKNNITICVYRRVEVVVLVYLPVPVPLPVGHQLSGGVVVVAMAGSNESGMSKNKFVVRCVKVNVYHGRRSGDRRTFLLLDEEVL